MHITRIALLTVLVATGFSLGLLFAPRLTRFAAAVFTALTISDFLQLAYRAAEEIFHVGDQTVEVRWLWIKCLTTRKGEQAVGQSRRALGRTSCHLDIFVDLG